MGATAPWAERPQGHEALLPPPLRLEAAPAGPAGLPWGVSLVRLDGPDEARAFLGPRDPGERARRSAVFGRPRAYRLRSRLHLGMHDRMEEYMLADGRVHEGDAAGHARAFPLHMKSVRLPSLRLEAGARVDLTCTAADWPDLPATEERYLRVEIGRLEAGPGACLAWSGNVACVWLGAIEGLGGVCAREPFTIRIRGTDHFAHSAARVLGSRRTEPGGVRRGARERTGGLTVQRGHARSARVPIRALPAGARHGDAGRARRRGPSRARRDATAAWRLIAGIM